MLFADAFNIEMKYLYFMTVCTSVPFFRIKGKTVDCGVLNYPERPPLSCSEYDGDDEQLQSASYKISFDFVLDLSSFSLDILEIIAQVNPLVKRTCLILFMVQSVFSGLDDTI